MSSPLAPCCRVSCRRSRRSRASLSMVEGAHTIIPAALLLSVHCIQLTSPSTHLPLCSNIIHLNNTTILKRNLKSFDWTVLLHQEWHLLPGFQTICSSSTIQEHQPQVPLYSLLMLRKVRSLTMILPLSRSNLTPHTLNITRYLHTRLVPTL